MLVDSITASTLKQYESHLKNWWTYAHSNQLDIFNTRTSDIVTFFNNRFKNGAKYSTINTARAAISLITTYDINTDGLLNRFMKGVYKKVLTKAKYASTWDATPVLEHLEQLQPLEHLNLREASEKVVTLLALRDSSLTTNSVLNKHW